MELDIVNALLQLATNLTIFTFVFNKLRKRNYNYKFKKDFFDENVVRVHFSKQLENNIKSVDFEKFKDNKFKETIRYFCVVLTNRFEPSVLVSFYNNINSLVVNDGVNSLSDFFEQFNALGVYYTGDNSISLFKSGKRASLYHELFHMASSYKYGVNTFSGFSYDNSDDESKDFGVGLNEGYTELLAKRYFGDVEFMESSYTYEVFVASLLERIVTKFKMERLYLTADFQGLMDELERYVSIDDIKIFIKNMDLVLKYDLNNHLNSKNNKIMDNIKKDISIFLVKTYYRKVLDMNLEETQKRMLLNEFFDKIKHNKEMLFEQDDIDNVVNKEIDNFKLINGFYSR